MAISFTDKNISKQLQYGFDDLVATLADKDYLLSRIDNNDVFCINFHKFAERYPEDLYSAIMFYHFTGGIGYDDKTEKFNKHVKLLLDNKYLTYDAPDGLSITCKFSDEYESAVEQIKQFMEL